MKTGVAFKAKALGGYGVEFPEALVAVKLALRTMAKFSEDYIAAIEHEFRQLRGSTKCCRACSGPALEESVVAASGLAELLACLGYGKSPLSATTAPALTEFGTEFETRFVNHFFTTCSKN